MEIKLKKLYEDLKVPNYMHPGDAGMDLYSREEKTLKPGERFAFSLGFALEIPEGFVSRIMDRSGLAAKHGLHTMAGVIDSNYRGEYKVLLVNLGNEDYKIEVGERIAQLLIQPVEQADIKIVDNLSESARGEGGFGGSGKK